MSAATTTFYQQELERQVAANGEIYRYLLAIAVAVGALLEVVDSSITNVALPHIQGNLGATASEAAWVVTGYAVANVITMPLAVWFGELFGKKSYFIFSMIGFTVASMICGLAPNLVTLVIARVFQGLFGGGLLAKAQAFLFESFPPEKQGMIQGLFGVCVIVGPIIGPTLGGYLTDNLDWRWIFFINLPIGILATIMCQLFIPKDRKRAPDEKRNFSIDWLGILSLALMLGSLQYVLEKGQDDDWFSSPVILVATIASVVAFFVFLIQELTTENPAVYLGVLKHKSVAIGVMYSFLLGLVLYGMNYVIPTFSQFMLGYTALQAGMLQIPGSMVSAFMFPLVGKLTGKLDARWMVITGTILLSVSSFMLASLTLDAGWDQFLWPSLLRGPAVVLMYLPLTLATVGGIPAKDIGGATAFMSLTRQMGGSVGIALLNTLLVRRADFHRAVLIEKVTPFSSAVTDRLHALSGLWASNGFSPLDAQRHALQMLDGAVQRQALTLSYADISWLVAIALLITLPFVFLLSSGKRASMAGAEMH
ncbi:MAG TPA: DHA2 family efflux MFS transporter permease subunit [Candidatus Obscuribacterales bacterium]